MSIKHDLKDTPASALQRVALRHGEPVELRAAHAGELDVRGALVWVTRAGDLEDRFLAPGDRIALAPGERLVVEPWQHGARAELHWRGRTVPAASGGGRAAWWPLARGWLQRAPQRSV